MKKRYPLLHKIWKIFSYCLYLGLTVLFVLELAYRFYIVDFYGGNLRGLNAISALEEKNKPTLLVIGDSFSADQQSYVNHLQKNIPDYRVINSAVPGTCIRQHALMASKRINRFAPKVFLYQIYVGNDLFEFHHKTDSPKISTLRKMYWWLSDRILVIGYINAKLPNIRQALFQDLPVSIDPKVLQDFSPEKYSQRSKLLFQAEPQLVENSALLKNGREADMEKFSKKMQKMFSDVPPDCKIVLLVIPHCIQLGAPYLERMQSIGAQVMEPEALTNPNYPFLNYLQNRLPGNVLVVNPLIWLQQQDTISNVYYNNDPHLNAKGQQLIGKKLLELLEKESIFE